MVLAHVLKLSLTWLRYVAIYAMKLERIFWIGPVALCEKMPSLAFSMIDQVSDWNKFGNSEAFILNA